VVFEDRVLGGIFGRRRAEETGGWSKLRNGELRGIYSSPIVIRTI
jgi:hypothetical protein